LLLACQLENTLERAIDFCLGEKSEEIRKDLYCHDGPLGTFSRKITLAAAIGLLGPMSHENFRLMRHVRNAFAHAKVPITFDTEEVGAACAALVRFNIFDPPEEVDQKPDMTPRERFTTICHETMIRLTRYTGHDPKFKTDDGTEKAIVDADLP
jgi:hypothetical protein